MKIKDRPWKYQSLAYAMIEIVTKNECNDTYRRTHMHPALQLKQPAGVNMPSERRSIVLWKQSALIIRKKRKLNGLTKIDRKATLYKQTPDNTYTAYL